MTHATKGVAKKATSTRGFEQYNVSARSLASVYCFSFGLHFAHELELNPYDTAIGMALGLLGIVDAIEGSGFVMLTCMVDLPTE